MSVVAESTPPISLASIDSLHLHVTQSTRLQYVDTMSCYPDIYLIKTSF